MMTRCALALCIAAAAGPVAAAGMKLERERLLNLEGPDTVGFTKTRFDFQHNFTDTSMLPVADLTLIYGVWDHVQLEGEAMFHSFFDTYTPVQAHFKYYVWEGGVKWAVLDQSREDPLSLAFGTQFGQSHSRTEWLDPASGLVAHESFFDEMTLYGIAHYDAPWAGVYGSVRTNDFARQVARDEVRTTLNRSAGAVYGDLLKGLTGRSAGGATSAFVPGLGVRVKIHDSKSRRLHLVGDYQFKTFDVAGAVPAWGAGLQFMYESPHIWSLFVSNTFGDTVSEGVFGLRDTLFYNFRYSYRF